MTIIDDITAAGFSADEFTRGGGKLPSVKICIKRLKAYKKEHGNLPPKPKEGKEFERDKEGNSYWELRQKVKRAIKSEAKNGGEE